MTRTYDLLEEGLEHAMPNQIRIERFLKQIKFLVVATRGSSSKQINLAVFLTTNGISLWLAKCTSQQILKTFYSIFELPEAYTLSFFYKKV